MALGGFKFAGYKVTKPEGATDADWALLVHKARLKAFWDANVASGAGWEFDRTDGDADWNGGTGVGGDVIFYVDGNDAQNLVSFFKKTGSVTKYYLIATMFNWQIPSGSVTGLVKISKDAVFKARYNNDNQYKVEGKTLFHTVGYTRFPENCLDAAADTYPQDALPLIPISGWSTPTSTASTNGTANMYKNASSLYIGCAVKGTNFKSSA